MHASQDGSGVDPSIDPEQLTRIEATHRGFGYQHLYAVACLLAMDQTDTDKIVIEHDEDIEIMRPTSRLYVQVKTRKRPLVFSDLGDVVARFDLLRREHDEGRRENAARFVIVSNTPPGPDLRARLAAPTWPANVTVLWPDGPDTHIELQLPAPWPDLGLAMRACVAQACLVPFPSLTPETLVLKLAGLVQYLATGHAGHVITRSQVRNFLEQLVIQLHDFPQPPDDYRRQTVEPDLQSESRVRLVVGVSGSGKTAWAAHAAAEHPFPLAYFDVGELPGPALASSLARELVARFLSGTAESSGGAALPAASGLELLALISSRLRDQALDVTIVLDNVHHVAAASLWSLVEASPNLRFILLGQTWPGQAPVEARFGIQAETLGGWALDDVAAAFAAADCPMGVAAAHRVLGLTAGMPLYVNAAARLAVQTHAGDVNGFLDAVEQRLTLVPTAQEVILADTFQQLSIPAKTAATLLELSNVQLESDEALALLAAAGMSQTAAAAAIRELARSGVIQLIYGGAVKVHDAFRLLARDGRAGLASDVIDAAREALVVMLQCTLPTHWTVGRFGLWVRLLPQTGRYNTLIDVATQDQFHQVGDPSEVKATLESAAVSADLADEERLWALDALVLWEHTEGAYERIPDLVGRMGDLANVGLDAKAAAALSMKQMLAAALRGDRQGVDTAHTAAIHHVRGNATLKRILQYNHVLSMFHLGADDAAASEALQLVISYYDHLGLEPEDVIRTTPAHIVAAVPNTPDRDDDLRRTGDSLNLLAAAHRRLDQPAAMACLHALKFYTAASAWRSAVHAGQDAIDELVALGDLEGARDISENHLLPVVTGYQLSDLLVAVRAQYAVVLAWCGDIDAAREEMSRLETYQVTGIGAQELANQRALIEQIANGVPQLPQIPTDN